MAPNEVQYRAPFLYIATGRRLLQIDLLSGLTSPTEID